MRTQVLKVSGMTCGGCAKSVTKALRAIPGVREVQVSVPRGEATIEFDEASASAGDLRTAVLRAGYGVDEARGKAAARGCCG